MALDKNKLSNDIFNLLVNLSKISSDTNYSDPNVVNQTLKNFSDGLSNVIHDYVTAADVDITTVNSSTAYQVPVTAISTSSSSIITSKGQTDSIVTVNHKNFGKLK